MIHDGIRTSRHCGIHHICVSFSLRYNYILMDSCAIIGILLRNQQGVMKKFNLKKVFTLPNQLTMSRIFMAPVLILLLSFPGTWTCFLAAMLFILACLTDLADGYLARRENQITSLGKFLDPLADKVLVSSVLIMLVELDWIAGWMAIIIICRDIMVTGLRAIAADEGIVISADRFGKIKTVVQMLALVPLILHENWFFLPMAKIGIFLLYIAVVLTVVSGYNYFMNFYRNWQAMPPQAEG